MGYTNDILERSLSKEFNGVELRLLYVKRINCNKNETLIQSKLREMHYVEQYPIKKTNGGISTETYVFNL